MKYSYKKCKKFLEDNGFRVELNSTYLGEVVDIDVYSYDGDVSLMIFDSLSTIVEALNKQRVDALDDTRSDVIYTLLKNNKDKLIEEE